jgi:SM-20-related protein
MNDFSETIADSLAENGYAIIENFISEEDGNNLLTYLKSSYTEGELKKAGVGRKSNFAIDDTLRSDMIRWIDAEIAPEIVKKFTTKVGELQAFLNQTLYLGLKDYEAHLTVYPAGAFYKRHLDRFRSDDARSISFVCYLNTDWHYSDGGLLRLYLPETEKEVLPLMGRLICFRADQLEHEVTTAFRERFSITGWFRNRPLGF